MKNYPLKVFFVSSGIFIALLMISNPGIQTSFANLLGLSNQFQTPAQKRVLAGNAEKGRVNRVIDGDTILMEDGRTVRYLNIDTPETKKQNTPIQCYGKEAFEYNKALVQGREVELVSDTEKTDKYGRDLRFVYLIGRNNGNIEMSVNALMVTKGYARSYIIKPNNTFEKEFAAYQYNAQQKKLGVWTCPNPFKE
jgi:endonuclease YncB( thermonuclease family)